ncbi:MAG: hypothetical protein ACM3ML_16860, partial [Micromonosporaceae bacterium]
MPCSAFFLAAEGHCLAGQVLLAADVPALRLALHSPSMPHPVVKPPRLDVLPDREQGRATADVTSAGTGTFCPIRAMCAALPPERRERSG